MGNKGSTTRISGPPPNWARPADIESRDRDGSAEINRLLVNWGTNEFDKRLVSFADKRDIWIGGPDWRNEVLRQAALDHPELKEPKKRGAPRKPRSTGNNLHDLLIGAQRDEDETLIQAIEWLDERNRARVAAGEKPWSDRDLIREFLKKDGYAPASANGLFESQLQVWANRFSRERKAIGKRRRSSRNPK